MTGNGRIQLPNQVGVQTQFAPGPNATPAIAQMQSAGGLSIVVVGGASRLEQAAAAYAAAGSEPEEAARKGKQLLDACERLMQEKPKDPKGGLVK